MEDQDTISEHDQQIIDKLLKLNDGQISAALLRAHLAYGYARCARLTDELVDSKKATYAPSGSVLKLLPDEQREGWLKGATDQDSIKTS